MARTRASPACTSQGPATTLPFGPVAYGTRNVATPEAFAILHATHENALPALVVTFTAAVTGPSGGIPATSTEAPATNPKTLRCSSRIGFPGRLDLLSWSRRSPSMVATPGTTPSEK